MSLKTAVLSAWAIAGVVFAARLGAAGADTRLVDAAKRRDVQAVRDEAARRRERFPGRWGDAAYGAVSQDANAIVRLLVERGAKINVKKNYGETRG